MEVKTEGDDVGHRVGTMGDPETRIVVRGRG